MIHLYERSLVHAITALVCVEDELRDQPELLELRHRFLREIAFDRRNATLNLTTVFLLKVAESHFEFGT